MTIGRKYNAENERIKREYFVFIKEAKRYSPATVDGVAKALTRFEEYTRYRPFKNFHVAQAVAFKQHLAEQVGSTGRTLAKATMNSTLGQLKAFFQWLAGRPGFKSRIRYSDAEYFNLSEKEARVATARRERAGPTLEQVHHVIACMPGASIIERRNRALIAFTLLTGARDSALASMKLKHVDLERQCVYQDAREVRTKNSKTFTSFFFPVGGEAENTVRAWVAHLREQLAWEGDDPLFPSTRVALGATRQFEAVGVERRHWTNASPVREIFKAAFTAAGAPYSNPHSLRKTLVRLGETQCRTPEQFKAWSQNLGHEGVLTTFYSYGTVGVQRQGQLLRELAQPAPEMPSLDVTQFARALAKELRNEA